MWVNLWAHDRIFYCSVLPTSLGSKALVIPSVSLGGNSNRVALSLKIQFDHLNKWSFFSFLVWPCSASMYANQLCWANNLAVNCQRLTLLLVILFPWRIQLSYKIGHQIKLRVPLALNHKKGYLGSFQPFFRLNVHNLQSLHIVDLQGMSTSFIVPFHNHEPMLVHWFSHDQKIGLAEQICWLAQPLLEFDCSIS